VKRLVDATNKGRILTGWGPKWDVGRIGREAGFQDGRTPSACARKEQDMLELWVEMVYSAKCGEGERERPRPRRTELNGDVPNLDA
jgi:hypothetical protein